MKATERVQLIKDDLRYSWTQSVFWRGAAIGLGVYLLVVLVLGIYWSREPAMFSVVENAQEITLQTEPVSGAVTTATLIKVADTMLHKPGGYLSNDIMPPGLILDNMPNWEYGVLLQVRDLSSSLREHFSRSLTQSTEDEDLINAEPKFHFDNASWIFPRTEDQYRDGIKNLKRYLERLGSVESPDAQFYTRADNLVLWLATIESRLGSLSQRLSASVGQRRVNTDLAGDPKAAQATAKSSEVQVKTPFFELDDEFYVARGSCWALIHFLRAIEYDFNDVLEDKNALVSLRQIIRELESTQQNSLIFWTPIILNGGGFGVFANHSLVMASYISRANAGIIELRSLLNRG